MDEVLELQKTVLKISNSPCREWPWSGRILSPPWITNRNFPAKKWGSPRELANLFFLVLSNFHLRYHWKSLVLSVTKIIISIFHKLTEPRPIIIMFTDYIEKIDYTKKWKNSRKKIKKLWPTQRSATGAEHVLYSDSEVQWRVVFFWLACCVKKARDMRAVCAAPVIGNIWEQRQNYHGGFDRLGSVGWMDRRMDGP